MSRPLDLLTFNHRCRKGVCCPSQRTPPQYQPLASNFGPQGCLLQDKFLATPEVRSLTRCMVRNHNLRDLRFKRYDHQDDIETLTATIYTVSHNNTLFWTTTPTFPGNFYSSRATFLLCSVLSVLLSAYDVTNRLLSIR